MSAWTPSTGETHPLQAAVNDCARHAVMPGTVAAPAPRGPEGWHNLTLADGQRAAIALELILLSDAKWGPRAAITYEVTGRATLERQGFSIAGRVVVDRATRAFLDVDCRLETLGRVG